MNCCEQPRKIPHPRPGTICTAAADDHPIFPFRAPNTYRQPGAGPFQNEDDFNLLLRSGPPYNDQFGLIKEMNYLERYIRKQGETCGHQIYFTHGDVALRNIMVRNSRSGYYVAALIDFEMSGFMPEYWEYVSASTPWWDYNPPGWRTYWNAAVDKFLIPYEKELKMEQDRMEYFGAYCAR